MWNKLRRVASCDSATYRGVWGWGNGKKVVLPSAQSRKSAVKADFQSFVDQTLRISNLSFLEGLLENQQVIDALTDKYEYKSEKHEQFWKEDNTADDCSRDSTNQNGAGTNILHIANSIILFRLYDIG